MWWKIADNIFGGGRRPISLAVRLTVWYAICAFALIFVSTAVLYQGLATNEAREDGEFLSQYLDDVRLVIGAGPPAAPLRSDRDLYLRLMDDQGRTLRETPGMSRELAPPSLQTLRSIGVSSPTVHKVVSRSGKPFQTIVGWVRAGADQPRQFVEIAGDRAREERLVQSYRKRLSLILAASLIGCAALGFVIARVGLRPIRRIGEAASHIGQTTLHERIAVGGLPAELQSLAGAFNTMLERLQDAFTRTARFSDDVAHELRTPIGNLRGEIEVAMSKPRSGDDYRETLGSCLEECDRISSIVERLLFLARSDAATEPLIREEVEVARELAAVHEFYEAAAAEAGVSLELTVAAGLTAALDRVLFQQAVGNIIANAVAHTPAGGRVGVRAISDGGGLQVVVDDTGRGIGADHVTRVFERFYRADAARTGAHAGLGLAVVRSIVERHGGQATLTSAPGKGTRVQLLFPHAQPS